MRWLLTAALPAVASLMATFANAEERKLYEWTVYTSPSVGTVNEVYVGDRLLEHGHGEWKECLTPRRTLTRKQGTWTGEYRAGAPLCKKKLGEKLYEPLYANATYGNQSMMNGVSWKKKGDKYRICQQSMGFRAYCIKDLSENDAVW